MSYLTQPAHADARAIASVLAGCHSGAAADAAAQVALEVLKKADVQCTKADLHASLALHGGRSFVTCHGGGIAVMFMGKHALVFATQTGGEVPWVRSDRLHAPDVDFFKCRVAVGQQVSDSLVSLVQAADQVNCEPDAADTGAQLLPSH